MDANVSQTRLGFQTEIIFRIEIDYCRAVASVRVAQMLSQATTRCSVLLISCAAGIVILRHVSCSNTAVEGEFVSIFLTLSFIFKILQTQ